MQLRAALEKLRELDEQEADLWLAAGDLTRCHLRCLESGDTSGFHWSLQILQGLIRRLFKDSQEVVLEELFTRLLGFFTAAATAAAAGGSESGEALAAFHVAKFAALKFQDFTGVEEFYRACFSSANTSCVRYEASVGLGVVLLKLGRNEEALACFRRGREFAGNVDSDSFAIASYWAARACVLLGDIAQAMETMLDADAGGGSFVSALAVALHAEMLASPVEDVVRRYTVARTLLTRLMPDLEKMFAQYCGESCCSPEFLLRYLNLDQFSAFFVFEASKFVLDVSEPVQRSFFVFDLACEMRKKLIEIQERQELYIDPRPHLEEGIHLFVTKSYNDAVVQLVRCHQMALLTGDLTCADLASDQIFASIQVLHEQVQLQEPDIHSLLLAEFNRSSLDGEDPEAWTLFHVGKSGASNESGTINISEEKLQRVKQALERSQTHMLKYQACQVLGQCISEDQDLDYLERMADAAHEAGQPELIISSLFTWFQVALLRHWRVDIATSIARKMLNAYRSSSWHENPKALAMALVLHMRGFIHNYLLDYNLGEDFMNRAAELLGHLPLYPPLAKLHFYLAARVAPGWSSELNSTGHLSLTHRVDQPPLPEHCFMRGKIGVYESYQSIKHLGLMVSQGHLDEAEYGARELLQRLKLSTTDVRYLQQAHVTMLLGRLACARHRRAPADLNTTLQIIQQLVDQSLKLGIQSAALVPDYGVASWVHSQHYSLLCELGEGFAALRKLEEVVRLECLEMDACFGKESWARIRRLDNLQGYFKTLHSSLWDFNELRQALVWGERERARDFLYTLEREAHREQYMKEFTEFDSDFDKAWSEIQSICEMVKEEAVFIIISQRPLMNELQVLFLHPQAGLIGKRYQNFTPVAELVESIKTSSPEAWMLLAEYYEMLVKPFAEELDRIKPSRIIFVPSEEMFMLPFAALFDWENKKHLIQSYALATAPSLRFFKQCQLRCMEMEVEHQALDHHPALLLVNPTSDLEYAEAEATAVEEFLNEVGFQVTRLDGNQVTKKVVLERLPESCWVHAACHATVDEDYPHGALLLAPDSDQQEVGLTADEIAGAPILRASGVVLSACSSGRGALHAEGVLGLPRFLHSRGVPAVVLSLWDVDDNATQLLMESMYKHLLQQGSEISQALRSAAVELLEDQFGPASDIKYWAPFGVSGCPFVKLHGASE